MTYGPRFTARNTHEFPAGAYLISQLPLKPPGKPQRDVTGKYLYLPPIAGIAKGLATSGDPFLRNCSDVFADPGNFDQIEKQISVAGSGSMDCRCEGSQVRIRNTGSGGCRLAASFCNGCFSR